MTVYTITISEAQRALLAELLDQTVKPSTKKASLGIGAMTENLLTAEVGGKGLTYVQILGHLRAEFGDDRSSIHCVRWYASKLNKAGVAMPKVRG